MKANKDPQIEIKDVNRDFYHVEFTRITGTAQAPETVKDIQVFRKKDFAGFQKTIDIHGIGITGYTSARVVHDPTIQEEKPKAEDSTEKAKPGPKKTTQVKS